MIGSRYRTGVNVINWPISRLLLSIGANEYARWITGLPLADSTGGFKCFRREVLEAIDFEKVRSNGYSFQIEMSFRAWKKGFRLVEIPDRVHRPGRGTEQDEQAHRPGGDLDGVVASAPVAHRPPVRGTLFYKMTGSGNDFVMLDGRATLPDALASRPGASHLRSPQRGRRRWAGHSDARCGGGGPDVLLELGRLPRGHVRQRGAL